MPSETSRTRLQAYLRAAEREFHGRAFNDAIRLFSKGLKIAQELKANDDVIKILDTIASCKERTGNLNGAFADAQQIIRTDPNSPIGYLRTAKILIALKAPEDAFNIYQMGLKRADPKSPFYSELRKRFDALDKAIPKEVDPSAKGHLSSLPFTIFTRIFGFLTEASRNNLACTQKSMRSRCIYSLLEQSIIVLDKYNSRQFTKLITNHRLHRSHKLLSCSTQVNEFLFSILAYIKKKPAVRLSLSKLQLYINQNDTHALLIKTLRLGLKSSLKHLELNFSAGLNAEEILNLLQVIFNECELRSLCIKDSSGHLRSSNLLLSGKSCHSLRFLQLDGPISSNLFSRCINLLVLIAPTEARISKFESDRFGVVHGRFSSSNDGVVPLPISHLKLSNASESIRRVDFTQYSYFVLRTIHLENVNFASEQPLFNPNWNQLQVLRLNQVNFHQPQIDLTAILKSTKNLQVLEISQMSLAHLSEFDVATSGLWLINLIFSADSLCNLEHLIISRMQLGPNALTSLIKGIKERKLKRLKVLGLVDVVAQGAQMTQVYKLFKHTYQHSYLLTNSEHEKVYNQEFNLFTEINFYKH